MSIKSRKPFIYALVIAILLIFIAEVYKALEYSPVGHHFRMQAQLKAHAASLNNALLKDILMKDPVIVAEQQIVKGNLQPIGYQPAGGPDATVGDVFAIGISCPEDVKLPVYYTEPNTCLRGPEYFVIKQRYTDYNQALVNSSGYKGPCRLEERLK